MAGNCISTTGLYLVEVFESICKDGYASKAELTERLHMDRGRINTAVDTLISCKWLTNGDGIIKIGPRPLFLASQREKQLRRQIEELSREADMLHVPVLVGYEHLHAPAQADADAWTPDRIKALRAKLGLSQREAAEEWGIPLGSLKQYERGARKATDDHCRILDTLDTKVDTKANG